ncbi:MAG: DUF3822 family protein [Prevotella sp.]|nr:DUF3822 family protein [Prevotella sp.]
MNTIGTASTTNNRRLTIRIGSHSLSFSTVINADGRNSVAYEPYTVKSGISMAANLREALKTADMPAEGFQRATVIIVSPTMLMPTDMFNESEKDMLYRHTFTTSNSDMVMHNVLPDLNTVAVFSINKDLKLVIEDNFKYPTFVCAMTPVWRYMHQRSFTGNRNKLYGYFHDGQLELFSFTQHRFKYCNTFETTNAQDSLYFLLYVWKQLMLDQERDEIHLVGNIPDKEWITEELRKFIKRTYIINPAGDFNRAQVTQIKDIPYDLMTMYVKGR